MKKCTLSRRLHTACGTEQSLQSQPAKSEVLASGPADDGVKALCADIWERGMVARRQGLRRLLGAPIGTRDFCLQGDGYLQQATTAAVNFTRAIASIGHTASTPAPPGTGKGKSKATFENELRVSIRQGRSAPGIDAQGLPGQANAR